MPMPMSAPGVSPEDMALVAQGEDPYVDGAQQSPSGRADVLRAYSPEDRIALGRMLREVLNSMPASMDEGDNRILNSIDQAINALGQTPVPAYGQTPVPMGGGF